jgi:outer membrane biosynthesis protein TonB
MDVWVVKSSGYANMDNDAMEAARAAFNDRAEKMPFPRDVTVASWVFVMSLKYPLY